VSLVYLNPQARGCARSHSLRVALAARAMTGTISSLPAHITMMKSHFAPGLMPGFTSPVLIPTFDPKFATSLKFLRL